MPIQPMNFPRFSYDEINPLLTGYAQGQSFANTSADMISKYLIQAKSRAELPYAAPQAEANLASTLAQNKILGKDYQWYDPKVQALIQLQKQQAGLAGSQAGLNRFQLKNPLFMNPEAAMLSMAMKGSVPGSNISDDGMGGASNASGAPSNPNMGGTVGATPGMSGTNSPSMNPIVSQFMAKYFMSPGQIAGSEEQARQNVLNTNKGFDEANTASQNAIGMNQDISRFLKNYKESTFKGNGFRNGAFPSSGWATIPLSFLHDFDPEQQADQAAKSVQSELLHIFGGKVTNQELNFLGGMKMDRRLGEKANQNIADFYTAAGNRVKELPQFFEAGTRKGLTSQEITSLFNLYRDQRPIIDTDSGKVNDEFAGTWKDYLTDTAINKFRTTGTFEPPIVDADIKHTARVHGMKEEAVRKMLKEQGRL